MASAERANSQKTRAAWPPAAAVAGWLLPGAGYWMIGQRARGAVVGITIVALFVMGLLIGGVRVLEVPGYGPNGLPIRIVRGQFQNKNNGEVYARDMPMEDDHSPPGWRMISGTPIAPIMLGEPFTEIRDKPWSIAQVMAGPIALLSGAWSVEQARPASAAEGTLPAGSRSHARLNEIGVLYTAVAGMLNLMVIIDAAYRAAYPQAADDKPAPRQLRGAHVNYPSASILAQSVYHYVPFYGPIPLWANWGWPWLLLPLVIGVSVVYKAIRVNHMRDLPRAAAGITLWIVLGMIAAAAALAITVKILQRV